MINTKLLANLCEEAGAPGYESRIRKIVLKETKPYVDEINIDNMGNVIAIKKGKERKFSGENFIRVPRLCKFTFMTGNKPHEYLTQFKPCAMSGVTVNFTPDNTYATYSDGSPVATELRINFQETKLIFAGEVDAGF